MNVVQRDSMLVVGILVRAPWEDLWEKMPGAWQDFFRRRDEIVHRAAESYVDVSLEQNGNEYLQLIGAEVSRIEHIPEGMAAVEIPAHTYIHHRHEGSLRGIAETFGAMYSWAREQGHEVGNFKLDIGYTPDGDEQHHDIHIGLQPEPAWHYRAAAPNRSSEPSASGSDHSASNAGTSALETERAKMTAGELYNPLDPELVAGRRRARDLLAEFNSTRDEELERRQSLLSELFAESGNNLLIEPPFYCDYGFNIYVGERVFMNFNCVVLDVAPVRIGNRVLIGPAVQIYAATHPLDAHIRQEGLELGRPVTIGDDVWIGGGAIILPGVSVGDRSIIAAGAVVAKDVPADVVVGGNPARVLRKIG